MAYTLSPAVHYGNSHNVDITASRSMLWHDIFKFANVHDSEYCRLEVTFQGIIFVYVGNLYLGSASAYVTGPGNSGNNGHVTFPTYFEVHIDKLLPVHVYTVRGMPRNYNFVDCIKQDGSPA